MELRKERELWDSYTDEQLKEFEDQIPDWKKGALQNANNIKQNTESLSIRNKLLDRISGYFQNIIKDDEEYENMMAEMEKMKTSLRDIEDNVSNKIKSSDMKVVQKGYTIYESTIKKMGSQTMDAIRKWDPDFDLLDFEKEAQYIFEEIYTKFLEHDITYLEGVCANDALGLFKSMILQHETLDAIPKFNNIVFMKNFSMNTTTIHPDSGIPLFQFSLEFAEINCLVKKFIREEIVSGYDNNLEYIKYTFVLSPWDEADVGKLFSLFNFRKIWAQLGHDTCSTA